MLIMYEKNLNYLAITNKFSETIISEMIKIGILVTFIKSQKIKNTRI